LAKEEMVRIPTIRLLLNTYQDGDKLVVLLLIIWQVQSTVLHEWLIGVGVIVILLRRRAQALALLLFFVLNFDA